MTYRGTVPWYGQIRSIQVSIQVVDAESEPLLVVELILGSRVTPDVRGGGPVTIDALP